MTETAPPALMQAFVYHRYGGPDVVQRAQVAKPVPRDDEVLIRIHATTVSSGDWRVRSLEVPAGFGPLARLIFGITGPRQPILGTELAGVIEAAGSRVQRFKVGDAVIAFPGAAMGCHAEFRALRDSAPIAHKPTNLSFAEAASLCFGGTTAMHFLRRAKIKAGDRVLVIGASGAVGTAIVQLASRAGASVTAVTSTGNLALVTALGAHRTLDYTHDDVIGRGETYDIVADTVGAVPARIGLRLLNERGRFLAIAGTLPDVLATLWTPLIGSRRVIGGPAAERAEDVREIAELAAHGVLRPVIDRTYDFNQLPEAHAYVATGRKRGSVVITLVDG